jgi:hypothetical protein
MRAKAGYDGLSSPPVIPGFFKSTRKLRNCLNFWGAGYPLNPLFITAAWKPARQVNRCSVYYSNSFIPGWSIYGDG